MVFYEKLPSIQFALPTVCAHCGEREGNHHWKVHSVYGGIFLLIFTSHKYVDFQVLVCDACKTKLDRLQRIWRIAFIACALSVLAALFVVLLSPPPLSLIAAWVFILGIPLTFFVLWRRGYYAQGKNIGKYDGKRFKFKNPEFDQQFAALNSEVGQPQI